ncbi:hypothetical protein J437_LFUL003886 [Ladona fulva]|uniref:La-related protein 6 n=1 Tax=Ladona fulva TaxID=123851 RepID=A0A8K0K5R4_LADFU|nr:hypothetical protein J437_LFUL003886 [Ladona fulva]
MPVPSEEAIPNIVVVPQCSGEEDLFCPPPMKHRDTRDSISSVDSDISLSYDSSAHRDSVTSTEGGRPDAGSDSGSESSSGGKDSGCDQDPEECQDEAKATVTAAADEAPFEPPDDDLAARIVAQVEFYFSDVNITKDAFLLKHVKRNKEGYVSLKLISSFKRVKHLAKDWRAVAYALDKSAKLQVNEARTKLRRLDPLPQYDETTPSRTVAAIDLPLERPTIENVAEVFSPCGEIALVRILRPGNPVPADARPFVAKHPELANTVCALVEFEKAESARRAVKEAAERAEGEGKPGMRVLELTKAATKKNSKGEAAAKKEIQMLQQQIRQLRQPQSQLLSVQPKKKANERANARPSFVADTVMGGGGDPEERPVESSRRRWSGPLERLQHRRTSNPSCNNSPRVQRHKPLCHSASSPLEGGSSPWVQRRMAAASVDPRPTADFPQTRPRSNSGALTGTLVLPTNVVRMPRGPDGSKGFRFGRRGSTDPSEAECPVEC